MSLLRPLFLSLILATVFSFTANAQFYVYKDGNAICKIYDSPADSIVFSNYLLDYEIETGNATPQTTTAALTCTLRKFTKTTRPVTIGFLLSSFPPRPTMTTYTTAYAYPPQSTTSRLTRSSRSTTPH